MRITTAVVLVAAALSAAACTRGYYRYHHGILTPATPDGMACRRECLALVGQCTYYWRDDVQVRIEVGRWSRRYGCPGLVSDCLELCPGAMVDPEYPPQMIPVGIEVDEPDTVDDWAD